MIQKTLSAAALLLLLGASAVHAQSAGGTMVAADVKPGDWAYTAVQDLASKGLIEGYPPDGNFLGGRALTRYEMATIISRVLARMDDLANQPGSAVQGLQAQVEETAKLADDFKVELVVIGTRLDTAEADITKLQSEVGDLQQGLNSAYDAIEEQAKRTSAVKAAMDKKANAGVGSLNIDGLLQVWAASGRDVTNPTTGNPSANGIASSFRLRRAEITLTGKITPQLYFKAQIDPAKQLTLLTSTPGATSTVTYKVNGTTTTLLTSSTGVNQSSNILQDIFVGYRLNPNIAVEFGQQKVPLSMEGFRSSAALYTIERTIFNEAPYGNGRVGDIRDTGALVRLASSAMTLATAAPTFVPANGHAPVAEAQLAVFDDAGLQQNTYDNNNGKSFMYHVDVRPTPTIYLGGYQEVGGGVNGSFNTQRKRVGGEFSTTILGKKNLIEGEMEESHDAAITAAATNVIFTTTGATTTVTSTSTPASVVPNIRSVGAYLLYNRTLSDKWQFAVRGDYYDPNAGLHGDGKRNDEFDLVAGPSFIVNKTGNSESKIQFNYIHKDIDGPKNGAGGIASGSGESFLGRPRDIYLFNFQTAF